jgi:hypothetical protein
MRELCPPQRRSHASMATPDPAARPGSPLNLQVVAGLLVGTASGTTGQLPGPEAAALCPPGTWGHPLPRLACARQAIRMRHDDQHQPLDPGKVTGITGV